jgi:hypothetical protein
MSIYKVEPYAEIEMMPDDGLWRDDLRVHPTRDTRPWWQRIKLSPWRETEKVRGKKKTIIGIKGELEL